MVHKPDRETLTELGRAINKTARDYEHKDSQDKGLARASTVAKRSMDSVPIHSAMQNRTSSTVGAPPTGAPPDASSPLPTDPTKQHGSKSFPIPGITRGMKSNPQRGFYDPASSDQVMGEALVDVTDHTRLGKKTLPQQTEEC